MYLLLNNRRLLGIVFSYSLLFHFYYFVIIDLYKLTRQIDGFL